MLRITIIVLSLATVMQSVALYAAPVTTFNTYRDEAAIFNRYYAKAFLNNKPGWGVVYLNTEDYNNFFGLYEFPLANNSNRLYMPNIIFGASWLVHKFQPKFFSASSDTTYSVFRGTIALSFRPFEFTAIQVGTHVANYFMSNPQNYYRALEQNNGLASYASVPQQQLRADAFFLYHLDTSLLKAKLQTVFSQQEKVKDLYALVQGKIGQMKSLLNKQKQDAWVALGPLVEARNAVDRYSATAAEVYGASQQAQKFAQAVRAGGRVDFLGIIYGEVHKRYVTSSQSAGALGVTSQVWSEVTGQNAQTDVIIGATIPWSVPTFIAYHRSQAIGTGFEIGVDVAAWINSLMGGGLDAEWKISLSRNVVSDDPLLQIPDRWAFKFAYFGRYDL